MQDSHQSFSSVGRLHPLMLNPNWFSRPLTHTYNAKDGLDVLIPHSNNFFKKNTNINFYLVSKIKSFESCQSMR